MFLISLTLKERTEIDIKNKIIYFESFAKASVVLWSPFNGMKSAPPGQTIDRRTGESGTEPSNNDGILRYTANP